MMRSSSVVRRLGNGNARMFLEIRRGYKISVGTGGRSSVAGLTATVFGSTGFLGRYVINKLGRVGTQVIAPFRRLDDENARHLKLMGDLGQILPVPFHARDLDSIADAVRKSDVVINLLGKQELTRNFDFYGSNVEAVSNIVRVCKEVGVPKFIHVSAMAADDLSPSEWLRRKAQAEAIVRETYDDAIILRSSVMFGEEDKFLNLMAKWTKLFGVTPLVGSAENKLQPVYVDNVAEAIRACVFQNTHQGKTYELAGPKVYTLKEIAHIVQASVGSEGSKVRHFLPDVSDWLPDGAADLSPHVWGAKVADILYRTYPQAIPGLPQLLGVRGDVAMLHSVNWVAKPSKYPQLSAFNIQATNLEAIGAEFLHRYRKGGHFLDIKSERHIPL